MNELNVALGYFLLFCVLVIADDYSSDEDYADDYLEQSGNFEDVITTKRTFKLFDSLGAGLKNPFLFGGHSTQSKFRGGCDEELLPPLNGLSPYCFTNSGSCKATCKPLYAFSGSTRTLTARCIDGEWQSMGTKLVGSFPPCEPVCLPGCKNNGICVAPNQCDCPDGFYGSQCQFISSTTPKIYESIPCFYRKDSVLLPVDLSGESKHSFTNCTNFNCTLHCEKGYQFAGGSTELQLTCKNDKWVPLDESDIISDCYETCDPPCENGGTCVHAIVTFCKCPTDFKGSECQYTVERCTSRKLNFNGELNCTDNYYERTCSLQCPEGTQFEFPPAAEYTCFYGTGVFSPSEIPQCRYVAEKGQPKPGSCITWRGSHFKTFDGKVYSFDSKRAYTMVQDANDNIFSITVQNHPSCSDDFSSCHKIITIFYQGEEYSLTRFGEIIGLTNNNKLLDMPLQVPGLTLDMTGYYIVLSLETLGVKLRWDGKLFVKVEVEETLWNTTTGLCGKIDDDESNDIMTRGGIIPKNILTMVNSWQTDRLEDKCNSVPKEQHACESGSSEKAREAKVFCEEVLAGKQFSACHEIIDVALLMDACQWDYCSCTEIDPKNCVCDTLNVYVKECARKSVIALPWRNDDVCPMVCTGGRVYMLSAPPGGQDTCGTSIDNGGDVDNSEEGCYCPEGLVLHENKCITKDKCTCRLRGKDFQPGATVPKNCNTCTCSDGQWVCTQDSCGARCSAIGDPHYTTFDGKRYDFMGQCSYYLIKTENFTVEAENVACTGATFLNMKLPFNIASHLPSCTKTVTIRYDGQEIHLKQNQELIVNGKEVNRLPFVVSGTRIKAASSLFTVVELLNGVQVWWDGLTRIYVDVPASFKGKTSGLCGTFNENQKDDFLTPENDIESSAIQFANKWKTNEKCKNVPEKLNDHPCIVNIQNRDTAEAQCKKIKSKLFENCHTYVDPEPFYQDCLYDVCSCEAKLSNCLCPMIAAYAQECALQGIKIGWRSEIKECGVSCSGGQIYQVCGNSCTRTCHHIATSTNCKDPCVEGCNCPEGQALDHNGECIPIAHCHCHSEGLNYHPGYKEIRSTIKGQELCDCKHAVWDCRLATPEEITKYPNETNRKNMCDKHKNYEFTTCAPSDHITCKNMHKNNLHSKSTCYPGCKCKDGYVLDRSTETCVKPINCPCHHGGKSYSENAVVQNDCNTCTCKSGRWECTNRQCSAECSAWGDSHFKTFDGKMYDYQGQCDYVLAKGKLNSVDNFQISIQNVPCGSTGVSCSKSLTIRIGPPDQQEKITLVRHNLVQSPQIFKTFTVRTLDLFVIIEAADLGLVVHWDKGTRVYIKVDPRWKNKVSGLCGNYNDNEMDDFQTPFGGVPEASAKLFGDSWKMQSYCPDAEEITDTCEKKPDRRTWALKKCGILKTPIFAACHSEVPVNLYYEKCVFDSCACDEGGDCECLCTALAAYAQECNSKGVPIKWRSQELCPIQCDERYTEYSPCVSSCPFETCDDILVHNPLTTLCRKDSCVEGCKPKSCPLDYVYANSSYTECVHKKTCRPICLVENGVTYYEGDVMEEDACHTCFCSRNMKICQGEPCSRILIPTTPRSLRCFEENRIFEHPFNCHMYYKCSSGENGLEQFAQSCGKTLLFHPINLICDHPENVYKVKPQCKPNDQCADGYEWIACALRCDRICHYHRKTVRQREECLDDNLCVGKCTPIGDPICEDGYYWKSDSSCRKVTDCPCRAYDDTLVKPGAVYKDVDGKICQCIHNEYVCDYNKTTTPMPSTTEQPPTPPSTVTPPKECLPDMFMNLIEGDQPLSDQSILASSYYNDNYLPKYSKMNSGKSWKPKENDEEPYLQIDLGKQEPVYGVILKGNVKDDEHVLTYKVAYVPDTHEKFQFVYGKDRKVKVFSRSVDPVISSNQLFDVPIEAMKVRIYPQTWHDAPSLRVELLGCSDMRTTTLVPIIPTTTRQPYLCDDEMGLQNGLMSLEQIYVSSELSGNHSKAKLKFYSESAWQPYANTPTEFVIFDFIGTRYVTGVKTKGGSNGWVTQYKIKYSSDGKQWNSIVDDALNDNIFNGNFDHTHVVFNRFNMPVRMRFLKMEPIKWESNIQLKIEPIGCYEPYPPIATPIQPNDTCTYCPGVLKVKNCTCDITKHWDGEKCIDRAECPCVVNGVIKYKIGQSYLKENCKQCLCKLGGVEHCVEKKCKKCKDRMQSKVSNTCECICTPCAENEILCPTSNVCIEKTKWCDGIMDCADDEFNCTKPTEPTTTEHPDNHCFIPDCSPDYHLEGKTSKNHNYFNFFATIFNRKPTKPSTSIPYSYIQTKPKKHQPFLRKATRIENVPTEKEKCKEFVCVPNNRTAICPLASCPPGYIPVYNPIGLDEELCAGYKCQPYDAICTITGRTFNTFDKTEFKYDVCNHLIARDLIGYNWDITLRKKCDDIRCHLNILINHHLDSFIIYSDLNTINYNDYEYNINQMKEISSQSREFKLNRFGQMILFSSINYGFWIIIDRTGTVKVGVSSQLKNQVDGLCGYYNGNGFDDKRKPDGVLATTTLDFGDSWSYGNQADCEIRKCPDEIEKKAIEICNRVKDQTLVPCANAINIDSFISQCLETTCSCLQASKGNLTEEEECRCSMLQSFVIDCIQSNTSVEVGDWRAQHNCPISCKPPFIPHDCYRRPCELTCDTVSDPNACPKLNTICFPGCYCPSGFVREGDTCKPSPTCGDCKCELLPHLQYITYDESNFTVNGNCIYVMSRDILENLNDEHKFQVLVTNHPCEHKSNEMCIGKITILFAGHKIHILKDEISNRLKMIVNSERIYDYDELSDWLEVKETRLKHIHVVLKAVQVEVTVYYPSIGVKLKVPSKLYGGKMEGLCGDCNRNKSNDMKLPNGKLITNKEDFGASWLYDKIPGLTKEMCIPKKEEPCKPIPTDSNPCNQLLDPHKFGLCNLMLDPTLYIEWCKKDICNGDLEQACTAIEAYANDCLMLDICINWHSNLCPAKSCPAGQEYQPCGTSCPKTCESIRDVKYSCFEIPIEGCFCPEGKILKNNTCVDERECIVCDDEGHHPGDIWRKDACTLCSCDGTSVNCTTKDCPKVATLCQDGYKVVKISSNKDECCDKHICVPRDTGTICTPPQQLECNEDQEMKLVKKSDGCQKFVCECKPIEECTPIHQLMNKTVEEGYEKIINNAGCCPKVNYVCKKELCSKPPLCPTFYNLNKIEVPERCCPIFTCEAPNKCIIDLIYTSSELGGEKLRNEHDKQKLVKKLGEKWQDGPCRECECFGSPEQGYHSNCLQKNCPQIQDSEDYNEYVLKYEPIPHECCALIKRVGCKYDGKEYAIGEKWSDEDDYCTSMECANTSSGIQIRSEIIRCDTECKLGYEYIPPNPKSHLCCGFCKPSGCVVDGDIEIFGGKLLKPNESWTSKDGCTRYTCENQGNLMSLTKTQDSCPNIDDCPESQVYDDGCCKHCNLTIVPQVNCATVKIPSESTIGVFQVSKHHGIVCVNPAPIEGLMECTGSCGSSTSFSFVSLSYESECSCCHATEYKDLVIELQCDDGTTITKEIEVPSSCSCAGCSAQSWNKWINPI